MRSAMGFSCYSLLVRSNKEAQMLDSENMVRVTKGACAMRDVCAAMMDDYQKSTVHPSRGLRKFSRLAFLYILVLCVGLNER